MSLAPRLAKLIGTLVIAAGAAAGCATGDENFKKIMSSDVGRKADDPSAYRNHYRSLLVATRELPNGNIEEKFDRHPQCPVFFEINNASNKIVGWRYEGDAKSCVIVP